MVAVATLVGMTLSFVSLTGGYMVVKQRTSQSRPARCGHRESSRLDKPKVCHASNAVLIGVALAQTRAASRVFATATGATDDIRSRLPMYESASLSHDNRCCPINISAEELQDHKCVPQDTN